MSGNTSIPNLFSALSTQLGNAGGLNLNGPLPWYNTLGLQVPIRTTGTYFDQLQDWARSALMQNALRTGELVVEESFQIAYQDDKEKSVEILCEEFYKEFSLFFEKFDFKPVYKGPKHFVFQSINGLVIVDVDCKQFVMKVFISDSKSELACNCKSLIIETAKKLGSLL